MTFRARCAVLSIAAVLMTWPPHGGWLQSVPAQSRSGEPAGATPAPGDIRWKAILLAGDGSIPAFDNATRDLARLLERRGVEVVATFTADPARVSPTVQLATHEDLETLPTRAGVSAGEGCLFFATSHGTRAGLRLPQDPRAKILSPPTLKRILAQTCGDAPTVLVVSACHSGTFIRAGTVGPSIIILTAARDVRRSFGCRAERRYTYYDGCLLAEFPKAATWQELHAGLLTCIQRKEAGRRDPPSEPQAFFGENVKDLPLPHPR